MRADLTGKLLRGKIAVERIAEEIVSDVDVLREQGISPKLVTIRVGERDDDIAYEASISRISEKLAVCHEAIVLASDVSESELKAEVLLASDDASVHGILIFRPLPSRLDEGKILEAIAPAKDVDGVTDIAMLGVYTLSGGEILESIYAPCTAEAVVALLAAYNVEVAGKRVVVVGRSLVIGKPLSQLLLSQNATVTVAHSKSRDLAKLTKDADIVVVCAGLASGGRANRLGRKYFAEGQVVVDVGIHADGEGLYGDVDTEAALDAGASVSPVPGGLGSVTTYILMKHVIAAAKQHPCHCERSEAIQ